MEDTSLIRMAVDRGLVRHAQLDALRLEQAALANKGLTRTLWDLSCEHHLLSEEQERALQSELVAETHHGRVIAGYLVVSRLGQGSMGEVFLGEGPDGGRVAIKLLPRSETRDLDAERRFHRESNTLMMLDHPHIVRGVGAGIDHGRSYLAMEWVAGPSLKERIAANHLLDGSQALVLLAQVALGLRYAWRSGILHRDVKPSNVMLAPPRDGIPEPFCAKVCDFGLARSYHVDPVGTTSGFESKAGLIIGTPHYMSPEQFEGSDDLEQRADIFSLAATIFHAVVGHPIQAGKDMAALMRRRLDEDVDLGPLGERGLSPKFVTLLGMMMRRQRRQRIQDWDWVLNDCCRLDPDRIQPLLDGQPGFVAPVRAEAGVDPYRRFAELTSSRIGYLAGGLDIKLRSAQSRSQDPGEMLALAAVRHELEHVRALAENLEVMAQDRIAERVALDLRKLSLDVCDELEDLAGRLMVDLVVEGDGSASGDAAFSRTALLNLVRNGVLACRSRGTVTIRIRNDFLAVTDQGPGIPPAILDALFDPLSPKRVFGLGATTARMCQRRQGGDVRLLVSGGGGTSFGLFWAP